MQHKVKLTVIDKRMFEELSLLYTNNYQCEACPLYNVGDEFIFERYGERDDFWHMGLNTLTDSMLVEKEDWEHIAGGPKMPHCSELWDSISRYIYTGLQGGSIMRGWMRDERQMLACCSDATRPVSFLIERMDYKAVYIEGIGCEGCKKKIKEALEHIPDVNEVNFKDDFTEVFVERDVDDDVIRQAVESCGDYKIIKIE